MQHDLVPAFLPALTADHEGPPHATQEQNKVFD
jgi:hypothetical protein